METQNAMSRSSRYSHCLSSSCQELLGKWREPSTQNILQERHHENTWKHYEEGLQRNATAINSLHICGAL